MTLFNTAQPFSRTDIAHYLVDDCREKLTYSLLARQHYHYLEEDIDRFLVHCALALMVWTAADTTLTTSVHESHASANDLHCGRGILHLAIDSLTLSETCRQPRYMARTGYVQIFEEDRQDREHEAFTAKDIHRLPLAPQPTWFDDATHALFSTLEASLLRKGYVSQEESHHFRPLFPTDAEVRYVRLRKSGWPTVIMQTCLSLR